MSLDEAHEKWKKDKDPSSKTISHNKTNIERFKKIIGDIPLLQIEPEDIDVFKDTLVRYPRNLTDEQKNLSPSEIIAWADAHPHVPRLRKKTINIQSIGAISVLCEIAIRNSKGVHKNPCAGKAFSLKNEPEIERAPFTDKELDTLFGSWIFQKPFRRMRGGAGEAQHWMPLLGFYIGARLEEAGQLLVSDIREVEGFEVIDITTAIDGEELAFLRRTDPELAAETEKHLKNKASKRMIPIRSRLKELGFLDFVDAQRKAGHIRLFHEMNAAGERVSKNWTRWWARQQRKLIKPQKEKVFHSFRHNFADVLRASRAHLDAQRMLLGHSCKDVTARYGRREILELMASTLDEAKFPTVKVAWER